MAAIAALFCPAILSLNLGVKQTQAAMAKKRQTAAPIDKLMITNLKAIPGEILKFMASHGVRVLGVDDDRLTSEAAKTFKGSPLANVLKLAAVTHPEWGYTAIQLADWDLFMVRPTDFLTPTARSGKVWLQPGSRTPTNGGLLVVRPSTQLRDSLVRALEHGFSMRDGWGGNYSRRDLLLAKPYVDFFCQGGDRGECCRSEPRSMWCFAASEVDQGLLFHLMIDGGRKSTCPPFGKECRGIGEKMFHTTLSPKPWQIEKVQYVEKHGRLFLPGATDTVERYNDKIDAWWKQVGPLAKEVFRKDRSCGATFDRQRELHRQWRKVRKPVMWVHVHKNGGTTMCKLAEDNEKVVRPNDGTCNSLALHDAFFPDGLAQKRQWTTCAARAKYFADHGFTWGQIEREINPGDYCKDDFIYGITLRDPVSRIESYANWNARTVNGLQWRGYLSCIQDKDSSACPAVKSRSPLEIANRGYQLWDNFNIRTLGGYDVMKLPPGGVNSSHLAAAIDLLEHFDLVLPLEEFSSKLAKKKMKQVLGWKGAHHARQNPHSKVVFTDAQKAAWAGVNRFDVQLYTHFAQRYKV